jgi:hypothetical protein
LNDADVRYLVVGGYAVFFHAEPRYTKDLDVWVEPSADNAPRVHRALGAFGTPLGDVAVADFAKPGITFQIGVAPNRIDILTEVSGVTFATAWPHRCEARYGDQRMWVLGREELVLNKRTTGRPQDLLDLEVLARHPSK